ncbi:hypothetical protein [Peribacillus sp. SI8-4]|uniref:hypothetical protein n=1 Tax=Peribacillus sp. SI8-4 TaxID=3048009 RepID=UPI002553395F|nr:hypothetical protein [Peribacillus sp. SI8-4]
MLSTLNFANNLSMQLYLLVMNFFQNVAHSQEELKKSVTTQKNAFWIAVLFIILGVASVAALIWACKTYGSGSKFLGEFKMSGLYIKIKCG